MTGKTHVSVGLATSILVTQPNTLKEFIFCIGVASIGSVISDIDVKTSESHTEINRVLGFTTILVIISAALEIYFHIGILKAFQNDSNLMRLLLGVSLFLGVCAYGKNQPHRAFMHSLLATALLTGAVYTLLPDAAIYFAISMLSHIAIDTLNYKKVSLFYPLPWRICFRICHARGFVNKIMFQISSLLATGGILYFATRIGMQYLK